MMTHFTSVSRETVHDSFELLQNAVKFCFTQLLNSSDCFKKLSSERIAFKKEFLELSSLKIQTINTVGQLNF
jgi:hypothetical protein